MQIHTTLSEALEKCNDWRTFCKEQGWNEYAVNEGGGDIEVTLTIEDAERYGLIPREATCD
ncbi:hypothetical protein LCGC14_1707870 [marine sediment metagenome]|uniref:Uncharacterized protein n=1 Tax=marine sediment metagenome TaxID=412755 RepID=A0A0F9HFM5_9ZZZZ